LSPSLKGDFAKVVRAQVTSSDLGYRVGADGKQLGMVLKKLPTSLQGKIELKGRLQCAPGVRPEQRPSVPVRSHR
jgi:hypothetical protein